MVKCYFCGRCTPRLYTYACCDALEGEYYNWPATQQDEIFDLYTRPGNNPLGTVGQQAILSTASARKFESSEGR